MKKLCHECGGYLDLTPPKFLEELTRVRAYHMDRRAIFLPFRINELEVTDIGPVRQFKAELGELNLLTGGRMDSRSSIFIALKAALTSPRPNYLITYERKKYSKRSRISLKFDAPLEGIEVGMNRGDPFSGVKCIVADVEFLSEDGMLLDGIAAFCRRKKMQLVLFGHEADFKKMKRSGVKVTRLLGGGRSEIERKGVRE